MTTENCKQPPFQSNRVIVGDTPMTGALLAERRLKLISTVCVLVSILCGSMMVVFLLHQRTNTDIYPQLVLKIIDRNAWTAQPPELAPKHLHLPADRLIIAHTNTTSCHSQAHCSLIVRAIQTDQIEIQKIDDIAYHFLIGGNGTIYCGRGWDAQGHATHGFNSNSLSIAFIGTFDTIEPSQKQLRAAKQLIDEGIRLQKLSKNYRLYGQRQLIDNTTSPGNALYEILRKSWKHWTSDVK